MPATSKFAYLITAILLAGCSTTGGQSGGALSSDLARQTAGPATLASFAELCGTPKSKIDRYVESYMRFAKTMGDVTIAQEEKMRKMFADGRSNIRSRFPSDAAVEEQCTKYPTDQSVLDRGIEGDFSGQI